MFRSSPDINGKLETNSQRNTRSHPIPIFFKQGPRNWLCQAAGAAAPSGLEPAAPNLLEQVLDRRQKRRLWRAAACKVQEATRSERPWGLDLPLGHELFRRKGVVALKRLVYPGVGGQQLH